MPQPDSEEIPQARHVAVARPYHEQDDPDDSVYVSSTPIPTAERIDLTIPNHNKRHSQTSHKSNHSNVTNRTGTNSHMLAPYELQGNPTELIDSTSQFKYYPAVDKKSYPSRQQVHETLSLLNTHFKETYCLSSPKLVDKETYFLVSVKYIDKLCDWVAGLEEEKGGRTPPELEGDLSIDNKTLLSTGSTTRLRKNLRDSEVKVIEKALWQKLVEWFGGGPEVERQAFKDRTKGICAPVRGRHVRIVSQKDKKHFKRLFLQPFHTVADLKKMACKMFDLKESDVRVHDYYKGKAFCRMDIKKELNSTVTTRHILDDNLIFLETRDEEGKFLIRYNTPGYPDPSTFQLDDIIDTSKPPIIGGAVGLRNLGNTCYMNSVVQCLSNIPAFKEFFISEKFKEDINKDNVLGYKGKLATAFWKVLDKLWSNQGSVVTPNAFRRVVAECKAEFAGYEQHDSQEFLSQLLDALHEDLNRIKKKPATEKPQANGRPDEIVAAEAFAIHKLRNDSIVNDLFTGLFKSTLTCPDTSCNNVSVTFDPFNILPLPLQSGETPYQVLQVIYVPMHEKKPSKKLKIIVPRHGPIFLLQQIIMKEVGLLDFNQKQLDLLSKGDIESLDIPEDNISKQAQIYSEKEDLSLAGERGVILFRSVNNKLVTLYRARESLSNISQTHVVIAYEVFHERRFSDYGNPPDENYQRRLAAHQDEVEEDYYNYPDLDAESESSNQANHRAKKEEDQGPRELLGYYNCPFVAGDTWHGGYSFNDDPQLVRLELIRVQKMESYKLYKSYCTFVQTQIQGISLEETELTKQEFELLDVFQIEAIGDTKDKTNPHMHMMGSGVETGFQMMGLYFGYTPQYREFRKQQLLKEAESKVETEEGIEAEVDVDVTNSRQNLSSSVKARDVDGDQEKKSHGSATDTNPKTKQKQKEKQSKSNIFNNFLNGFSGRSKSNKPKPQAKPKKINKASSTPNIPTPPTVEVQTPSKNTKTPKNAKKTPSKATKSIKNANPSKVVKSGGKGEEEVDEMRKLAEELAVGSVEEEFIGGKFFLRPHGDMRKFNRPQYRNYYNNYNLHQEEDDECREPIVLKGVVDIYHNISWGQFNVKLGFTKGEFFMKRWESRNFNTTREKQQLFKNINSTQVERALQEEQTAQTEEERKLQEEGVFSERRIPRARGFDNRILVLVAHRTGATARHFSSIPHALLMPYDFTESDAFGVLRAKFKLLLERSQISQELVDASMRQVKVLRANQKFMTVRHNNITGVDYRKIGKPIEEHSDWPLRVSEKDMIIWLVVDWGMAQVPFEKIRPSYWLSSNTSLEQKMTLNSALELFSRTEKLNKLNSWYCGKCKQHQEAFKRLQIWSLPAVLVVQFKRFSQHEGRNTADKLEIPVDFPLDLNLQEFALNSKVVTETERSVEETTKALEEFQYSLVGVSSHVGGGLGAGHYIASARNENDGKWYNFNDDFVSPLDPKVSKQMIINPDAYVIFYARTNILKSKKPEAAEIVVAQAEDEDNKKAADVDVKAKA